MDPRRLSLIMRLAFFLDIEMILGCVATVFCATFEAFVTFVRFLAFVAFVVFVAFVGLDFLTW